MIVDSGADRSLLPRALLKRLGLHGADVAKDARPSGGVRSRFVTWYSTVPLVGQIFLPPGAAGPAAALWGPEFPLQVRFATNAPALAGRNDFFQPFNITFAEGNPGCEMIIQVR